MVAAGVTYIGDRGEVSEHTASPTPSDRARPCTPASAHCGRYLGAAGQQCTHHVYDAHQRALPSTEPNALLEQGKRQGSARLRVCGVGNEIDGRVARSVGHAHHQAPPICMAGLPLNKGWAGATP